MAFASDKGRQGAAGVSTGFDIDNSLRFNDDDSAYLSRSFGGITTTKISISFWSKGAFAADRIFYSTSNNSGNYFSIGQTGSSALDISIGGTSNRRITNRKFRDPSAWYHFLVIIDSTQATASDRIKLYVNGIQETSFSTSTTGMVQDSNLPAISTALTHGIGVYPSVGWYYDGYMAEVHFIEGTALDPTSFGETGDYGEWKAKKVSGLTYGTNGFYLDFKTSGTLGNDANGSNNWTTNNLASTDQMVDTPTNNFATWNPLKQDATKTAGTFKEGNLVIEQEDGYYGASSTMGFSSGKWYAEVIALVSGGGWAACVGIAPAQDPASVYWNNPQSGRDAYVYYGYNGKAPQESDVYGATYTTELIGIAVDMDNGKIWFSKSGVWQNSGNPATGANPATSSIVADTYEFIVGDMSGAADSDWVANFGQDSSFAGNDTTTAGPYTDGGGIGDFFYEPPSGFLALCTKNLPDPAVIPSEHFNTVLWTGTGTTSARSFTGIGFQPDLVWNKQRSDISNNRLWDSLRGGGKELKSNTTDGDETNNAYGYLSSFDSDGFSTVDGGSQNSLNISGNTYVAWNWKANGTGVSNTSGTITSTVSANADAGFSIVSYVGDGTAAATVGHGLNSTPQMVVIKNRDTGDWWDVYTETVGKDSKINWNSTTAAVATGAFNNTLPTSTVFSVRYLSGSVHGANNLNTDIIAYCFHSVDGYSKVGSYTGNGLADGTFVYTGFRPAYVMIKRSSGVGGWMIMDGTRDTDNPVILSLSAHNSTIEADQTSYPIDFTSNGIKIRSTGTGTGGSGSTYIYLAFAESPFKHTNAR